MKSEPPIESQQPSVLGEGWVPLYLTSATFSGDHFEAAMLNLIKNPNINSTVIMRADILKENYYDEQKGTTSFISKLIDEEPTFPDTTGEILTRNLHSTDFQKISFHNSPISWTTKYEILRRIIPRNPFKDHIINQTCLVLRSHEGDALIVYSPHIDHSDHTPFYLPPVRAIGILYHKSRLSIHYSPFDNDILTIRSWKPDDRPARIALRLLQTSAKHSRGVGEGYEKRVKHDLVVSKQAFQDTYISLKKKYLAALVSEWCESTDPKKHVFEDLAIAAFLIEFWALLKAFSDKSKFEFRDLGCGNGLLVHILIQEGYKGMGMDARRRKSWSMYPREVQESLVEQIVVPKVLLKPHPSMHKVLPGIEDNGRVFHVKNNGTLLVFTSRELLESPQVCTTEEFPANTFIIGNHSDELTCWIPLLGFPFLVIPCCLHALSGARRRYAPRKTERAKDKGRKKEDREIVKDVQDVKDKGDLDELKKDLKDVKDDLKDKKDLDDVKKEMKGMENGKCHKGGAKKCDANENRGASAYGALVDHVEDLAVKAGWVPKKEMLRIPSTRNAAIVGTERVDGEVMRVYDILAMEGGAEGWVENSMALMKKAPRNH